METNVTTFNNFTNVVREPANVTFNGVTKEINKDVLLNEDTGEILGVVGKGYKLVQNSEVRDFFDTAFENYNVEVLADHSSNNHSKWVREIVFNDDQFSREIVPGDNVKVKLKAWNGYDGITSVGFALESYRLVCSNGMMGWGKLFSTRLPHVGSGIVDTIKNTFQNSFQNYNKVFDKFADWTKKPYDEKDFKTFITTKTKEEGEKTSAMKFLSEKQADAIKGFYPVVMNKFNESNENLWTAYNVLTYIASHETATKNTDSHLFTQGYGRMTKLTESFIKEVA